MKIKKRFLSLALSGVLVLGMMPGMTMTALAADNVSTYTLQIPSTLNVSAAGWNATSGLTAAVTENDTFDSGKKLSVTASSANSWALKSGDNTVGYNLATATGTYSSTATPASWEFTAAELNASDGTNKAMGIIVEDYSSKPAGTYTDTVTFTASVEDARQLYSITLTGPYTSFTLVMEYQEGDTWNDMATKYPDYIKIYSGYVGFHTDGLICDKATGKKVSSTDVINPNKTYTIE